MIGYKVGARTETLGADSSAVPGQKPGDVARLLSAESAFLVGPILNRGAERQLSARLQKGIKRSDALVADSDLQSLDQAADVAVCGAAEAAVRGPVSNFFDHLHQSDQNLVAGAQVRAQPLLCGKAAPPRAGQMYRDSIGVTPVDPVRHKRKSGYFLSNAASLTIDADFETNHPFLLRDVLLALQAF
jgi:hypothetical protein